MLKIASLALLGAFAFALIAPAALARDLDYIYMESYDDISWGVHPWDVRPRRHYENIKIDPYRYGKNYFYLHPDRSQTHALHPYYRDSYYDPPVDLEHARYSLLRREGVQYAEEFAYRPQRYSLADCDNYSYSRPNYRIPPYGYFCSN